MAIVARRPGAFTPIGISPAAEGAIIEWSPDGADILALPGTLSRGVHVVASGDGPSRDRR